MLRLEQGGLWFVQNDLVGIYWPTASLWFGSNTNGPGV